MAKALTWTDVPRESAELLLTAPFSPEADEEVIRECMRVEEAAAELESDEPSTATPTRAMTGGATTEEEEAAMAEDITSRREAVLVTMYQEFVSLARSLDFSERKLSTLLSIVRSVHVNTTAASATIRQSYDFFTSLLLSHSVERPPYSAGVFSPTDAAAITSFAIANYYQHFKLYQHAFAKVGTLSVKAYAPSDFVETPEQVPGISCALASALTQDEKDAKDEEERRLEEERLAQEEAARQREEEEILAARVAEEYASTKAETVAEQVAAAVAPQLAKLEEVMQQQFADKEAKLLSRIAALEDKLKVAAGSSEGAAT